MPVFCATSSHNLISASLLISDSLILPICGRFIGAVITIFWPRVMQRGFRRWRPPARWSDIAGGLPAHPAWRKFPAGPGADDYYIVICSGNTPLFDIRDRLLSLVPQLCGLAHTASSPAMNKPSMLVSKLGLTNGMSTPRFSVRKRD